MSFTDVPEKKNTFFSFIELLLSPIILVIVNKEHK